MTASTINPASVVTTALKSIKSASDYHQLATTIEEIIFEEGWNNLPEAEQVRIIAIVNDDKPASPKLICDELASCGSKSQLEEVKATYGELAVKAGWKLLAIEERDRLTLLCKQAVSEGEASPSDTAPQPKEEASPVPEQTPAPTKVAKRNLTDLSSDLQRLDELLDTIVGEQGITPDVQVAIDELLQERDSTQAEVLAKLDNYCDLINSRVMWAQARKADADRLAKLAESDFKTVDFLKARLKLHLESTDQKKIRTKRYNISINGNGGKQPMRFDNTAASDLPEQFQRVTIEPDKERIRAALESGEELKFAYLVERETHLRIK